jgi:hypothetical protein
MREVNNSRLINIIYNVTAMFTLPAPDALLPRYIIHKKTPICYTLSFLAYLSPVDKVENKAIFCSKDHK